MELVICVHGWLIDITCNNKLAALGIEWLYWHFYYMGFTPCKTEKPLQGMELQEKGTQKD